jgi:hypothetical protein
MKLKINISENKGGAHSICNACLFSAVTTVYIYSINNMTMSI